jgi:hypothetical protein
MIVAQIYCTLDELIADLGLVGNQPKLFDRIKSASTFIYRRLGQFIPVAETRDYQGNGSTTQQVDFLLSATSVKNNGATITDFDLYPLNGYWQNGPHTRIEADVASWDVVEVAGAWGKYLESVSIGETVTQLIGATTLTVANGANVSPGMVLLLDAEQELVDGWDAATAATSLLNGAIDEADEEITVDNGAEFHEGEVIQISTEDCFVRMVRGNILVVGRGWNGTTKAIHADDSPLKVYRTVKVTRAVNGTSAAAHSNAAAARYIPPDDVNWLCRMMAGLAHKKAQSGFSGRVGNAETGESFYYNEFPSQIKDVKKNYNVTQL